MKKSFVPLLSLLLALILLTACGTVTPSTDTQTDTAISSVGGAENPGGLYLNAVLLNDYTLVYGRDNVYAKFAAILLKEYFAQEYQIDVPTSPDAYKAKPHEILVGDTNRITTDADTGAGLGKDQFQVTLAEGKILLNAAGYMVGGAARELTEQIAAAEKVDETIHVTVTPGEAKTYVYKEAQSVMLYIGDGMGVNHIEWAKQEGMETFFAEDMPYQGFAQTYSADDEITDSAASATALATGFKTKNGYVGLDPKQKTLKNIRELAYEVWAKTGVITTDVITGATPSGFTVHVDSRNDTEEIEQQQAALLEKNQIDILKGSVDNKLLSESRTALKTLSAEHSPFFLMVEEGYIDKHSHDNKGEDMLKCVNRFNEVIAYAMEFVLLRGDVLFVVTADHETGGITRNGEKFAFTTEDHTAADVRVFAMGDGAEYFNAKTVNNVQIPHQLAKVFGHPSFGDPTLQGQ